MSREAVVEFLAQVRADSGIRDRLGASPSAASYVAEGQRAGCEFSADELRSVTNAEQFYCRAMRDPALSRRIAQAPDEASVLALARAEALACELEDLQVVLRGGAHNELSEAELDAVAAGGGGGWSFPKVSKTPVPPFGSIPIPYPG